MNFINIAFVQFAHENKWTAKQVVRELANEGLNKDESVKVLSELIPEAHSGLNDECVKLLCNAVKEIVKG